MSAQLVTVTWMDGVQEIYRCDAYSASDGSLYLQGEGSRYSGGRVQRSIPLHNVRVWKGEPE